MKHKKLVEAVRGAQNGEREAVELLYNEWSGRLTGFIRRRVSDRQAAEDILSETFVTVMEHIGDLKTPEAFGGWIYSVAYNKCMDFLKGESKREELSDDDLCEPVFLPEDYAENADTRRRLGEVIEGLKPEQRRTVLLYYYEQRSIGEVAKEIGKSESAVKKILQRARGRIKKQVERLCAGGAVFTLVPMESLLGSAVDDSYASAVTAKGAHVVGHGIGVKIAVVGAIAAVAVPFAIGHFGGGGYVPEDVISRTEQLNSALSDNDSNSAKPSGITIACEPEPVEAEEFYILTTADLAELKEPDDADAQRLCDIMINVFGFDFDISDVERRPSSVKVEREHIVGDLALTLPSFNFVLQGETPLPEGITDIGRYELKRYTQDDYPKEKLVMTDGRELDIGDAIKQTDGYINGLKEYGVFEPEEELRLINIFIGDTGYGAELILEYEQRHFGLPFDTAGFNSAVSDQEIDAIREDYAMRSGSFTAIYLHSERAYKLYNFMDNRFAQKQAAGSVMSFDEAVQKLTDTLAPNMDFTVSEASLRYCCYYTYEADNRVYTYRPMWTFTLKEQKDRGGSLQYLRPRIMGYVDAINGDVYYSDYERHYIEKCSAE